TDQQCSNVPSGVPSHADSAADVDSTLRSRTVQVIDQGLPSASKSLGPVRRRLPLGFPLPVTPLPDRFRPLVEPVPHPRPVRLVLNLPPLPEPVPCILAGGRESERRQRHGDPAQVQPRRRDPPTLPVLALDGPVRRTATRLGLGHE